VTAARPARVVASLAACVPELNEHAALGILAAAGADRGRSLRELDDCLREHPRALAVTPAGYPLALVRVAHALIEAGHRTVTAPACAGCATVTIDLRRLTPAGRVCGACAARRSTGECARCGQVRRISARRPEGGICAACYDRDEQVIEDCSGCGRRRRPAVRLPDGSARCQTCASRPARTCSGCGEQRTAAKITGAGPVCASCYQQPRRPCGRCGRLRKIARRATAGSPDLCDSCYKGVTAIYATCGEARPCQRISSGSPVCRQCRTRPPRPCFRCGRDRPVQAEWPAGPVCAGCYEHVRRHPAACARCHAVRPLIGEDNGTQVCGPCAGAPALDYSCRECGRGGKIHSGRRCFRCVLAERAQALLAGPEGEVSAQLQPLLAALTAVSNPATVVTWLGKSRSAVLLGQLAKSGQPVTHDALDELPQAQSLHYIREVLVSAGVLPSRDEFLERLVPWLEHLLQDKPPDHARLVRPFAYWFVLRRARRAAARRAYSRGAADFARARVLIALDLLSWLDRRDQSLHDLTQADLEHWLTEGPTSRRTVRYFLQWARARSLTGDLTVPLPPRSEPVRLLGEEDHVQQLDRCLADDSMPLDLRVGGALVLLFGMLVSRVTQLTKDDVTDDGQAACLAVDGHRLLLPPRLAGLIRQLRDQDEPRWTLARLGAPAPWLFPGRSPERPVVDIVFGTRLQRHGISTHAGRNTGRLALAAELPASVLADLTGISISTAERWSQWAKRDWASYVGQRATDIQTDPGLRACSPESTSSRARTSGRLPTPRPGN
jgi:hypothetical protein